MCHNFHYQYGYYSTKTTVSAPVPQHAGSYLSAPCMWHHSWTTPTSQPKPKTSNLNYSRRKVNYKVNGVGIRNHET